MSQSKGSPRKFAEKIALLNKKEAEANAEFAKIIKEVEETTRAPYPSRTSSFSSWNGERPDSNSQQVSLDSFNYHHNQPISTIAQQHDTSQIHLQQQQLHLHQQYSPDSMSIQTPDGVPSIEIFPIQYDDDYGQQQQVTTNNNFQLRNDCSNPISAARSLPDIANLRVSGSFAQMAPSYSDQRIPSDYNYNNSFDANSNIVTDLNDTQTCYFQNNNNNDSTAPHHLQETSNQVWHQSPNVNNQYRPNSLSQHQAIHQNYYQHQQSQQEQQQIPLVRGAGPKGTVLGSWTNTVSLNAPKTVLNGTLSKSSEGCYNHLGNNQGDSLNLFDSASTRNTGQTVSNPIMRSSSFNNIENINVQQVDTKTPNYMQHNQQPSHRPSFEPSQSQFYD